MSRPYRMNVINIRAANAVKTALGEVAKSLLWRDAEAFDFSLQRSHEGAADRMLGGGDTITDGGAERVYVGEH